MSANNYLNFCDKLLHGRQLNIINIEFIEPAPEYRPYDNNNYDDAHSCMQ